jgi:hypothetical protein
MRGTAELPASGETLENEIVDPRFCNCVVFASGAIASEESMLVHVTCYWRNEKCGHRAAWNGAHLRAGDCAVDPRKIPYGSTIIFPDVEGAAVDTGPSVVSRKSARCNGRCAAEKNALVIDRFFETRDEALAWTKAHGRFMTVRVVTPESTATRQAPDANQPGSL